MKAQGQDPTSTGNAEEDGDVEGSTFIGHAEEEGGVEKEVQAKKANLEQPTPLSIPASSGVEGNALKAFANGSYAKTSMKEATLECVLTGAIMDEGPSHFGKPQVVDDSSVISEDYD
jgi:hypothetical protein